MTDATEAIVVSPEQPCAITETLKPADIVRQVRLIQEVMTEVMHDGEHYGKIPGCGDKPTLLQPGAQMLMLTFRLAPQLRVERRDLEAGHREITVYTELVSINSGQVVGMGVGSCSTMESKYRYRNIADFEVTGDPIPQDSKERKAEYRRQGFGMKKVDGVWEWVKFKDSGRVENPDIADTYNTVLKIAAKRSLTHAVLNTTAASDMFTQDIEDLPADSVTPSVPVEAKANAAELDTIATLKADLGLSDEVFALKLKQGGITGLDTITSADARRLITNLGEILKRRSEPAQPTAEPEPYVPGPDDDEIPF